MIRLRGYEGHEHAWQRPFGHQPTGTCAEAQDVGARLYPRLSQGIRGNAGPAGLATRRCTRRARWQGARPVRLAGLLRVSATFGRPA